VDFHAQWCRPCLAIAPKYDELAVLYPHVQFLRVDVDSQHRIALKYHITAMPTFIAIVDGEVKGTVQGADPEGLTHLVAQNARLPVPRLPAAAEEKRLAGNELFQSGKWEEAYEKYSKAIEAAPTSALLYANRSAALLKASQIEQAVADGLKATELDEMWGKGWYRYAEALAAEEPKNIKLVAECYLRACEAMPEGTQKNECKMKLEGAQEALENDVSSNDAAQL